MAPSISGPLVDHDDLTPASTPPASCRYSKHVSQKTYKRLQQNSPKTVPQTTPEGLQDNNEGLQENDEPTLPMNRAALQVSTMAALSMTSEESPNYGSDATVINGEMLQAPASPQARVLSTPREWGFSKDSVFLSDEGNESSLELAPYPVPSSDLFEGEPNHHVRNLFGAKPLYLGRQDPRVHHHSCYNYGPKGNPRTSMACRCDFIDQGPQHFTDCARYAPFEEQDLFRVELGSSSTKPKPGFNLECTCNPFVGFPKVRASPLFKMWVRSNIWERSREALGYGDHSADLKALHYYESPFTEPCHYPWGIMNPDWRTKGSSYYVELDPKVKKHKFATVRNWRKEQKYARRDMRLDMGPASPASKKRGRETSKVEEGREMEEEREVEEETLGGKRAKMIMEDEDEDDDAEWHKGLSSSPSLIARM